MLTVCSSGCFFDLIWNSRTVSVKSSVQVLPVLYISVAHTQIYGYGFRPYEYSSLSHGTLGGAASDVSLYRQRELELGMHGMRSALYPCFYVVVSFVADVFGLDVRPFVVRHNKDLLFPFLA